MTQRDPIYKGSSYDFQVKILKPDESPYIITNDVVKAYIDKKEEVETPAIVATADVATQGALGIAIFNLTPEQTDSLTPGSYFVQSYWFPDGTLKKYPVANEKIVVKKNVPKVIT